VINGVGGVKIGDSYFLSLRVRWSLFNYEDKELILTIIDSLGNKKVAEIETKIYFTRRSSLCQWRHPLRDNSQQNFKRHDHKV